MLTLQSEHSNKHDSSVNITLLIALAIHGEISLEDLREKLKGLDGSYINNRLTFVERYRSLLRSGMWLG